MNFLFGFVESQLSCSYITSCLVIPLASCAKIFCVLSHLHGQIRDHVKKAAKPANSQCTVGAVALLLLLCTH